MSDTEILVERFRDANDVVTIDMNNEFFVKEVITPWFNELTKSKGNYRKFLESLNLDIQSAESVEIDSTKYDSILTLFDKTSIITPYAKSFSLDEKKQRNIIMGSFYIDSCGLTRVFTNFGEMSVNYKLYLLHNPYSYQRFNNLRYLGNKADIALGIYGKTYDADKDLKIKQLQLFASKLGEQFSISNGTNDDNYCYVLTNKIK